MATPPMRSGCRSAIAAVAALFIPLAIELLGLTFQRPLHISPWPIASLVLATVLAPLVAGILVRRLAPALAARFAAPAARTAGIVLALGFLAVLLTAWPSILALLGTGALAAVAAFVLIGLSRRTCLRRSRSARPDGARARHRDPSPRRRFGDRFGELSRREGSPAGDPAVSGRRRGPHHPLRDVAQALGLEQDALSLNRRIIAMSHRAS